MIAVILGDPDNYVLVFGQKLEQFKSRKIGVVIFGITDEIDVNAGIPITIFCHSVLLWL